MDETYTSRNSDDNSMLKKYQFQFKPLASLFFVLILILLISLSLWQFKRAEEKKQLLAQYELAIKKPILDLSTIENWQNLPLFQQVKIRGHYDNQHHFLLDNKTKDRQVGYEVLTPFYSGDHVVLVNRGWIARTSSRQQLPELEEIKGEQVIRGRIIPVPKKSFTLGNIEENPEQWPRIIQAIDLPIISSRLNENIDPKNHTDVIPAKVRIHSDTDAISKIDYRFRRNDTANSPQFNQPTTSTFAPFIIQLAPEAPHGFVRDWPVTVISPAKHIGYSIQWGLLAIVQLIVLVRYNFQRKTFPA